MREKDQIYSYRKSFPRLYFRKLSVIKTFEIGIWNQKKYYHY
jgi:hypothetical protein